LSTARNQIILLAAASERELIMRTMNWGLAGLLGLFASQSIGVGEAWSQRTLFAICNQSSIKAAVALTAHQSPNNEAFLIRGWWIFEPGECGNLGYIPNGWAYFYAEAASGADIVWAGRDQRFCVTYPGPFERIISSSYHCSGIYLKSFTGYFLDGGTFTLRLD
jgi:uncharacterized membrane protein